MTTLVDTLLERNETFAKEHHVPTLKMMPSLKTMIIGCVDPRVDPAVIFGLEQGAVAVIRNVGGRVYPSTLQTMGMLGAVTRAKGGAVGAGWNLVVLHHTDCGINCLAPAPELLAKHFGVATAEIDALKITDPYASVAIDVAALKATASLPDDLVVTGLVYDVETGKATVVVPSAPLRPGAGA